MPEKNVTNCVQLVFTDIQTSQNLRISKSHDDYASVRSRQCSIYSDILKKADKGLKKKQLSFNITFSNKKAIDLY